MFDNPRNFQSNEMRQPWGGGPRVMVRICAGVILLACPAVAQLAGCGSHPPLFASTTSSSGAGGAGTGGSGSGGAGTGGCSSAQDCDDHLACTLDACQNGACLHTPGPSTGPTACPAGQFCEVGTGCV